MTVLLLLLPIIFLLHFTSVNQFIIFFLYKEDKCYFRLRADSRLN